MAWPFTARYQNFIANTTRISAAFLNAVQDAIIGASQLTLPPIFGTGTDGAATMDGVATVAGMVPAGGIYTATRDYFFTDLTINNGILFNPKGFRVYGTGTLTTAGTATIAVLHNNASGATPGTAPGASGILGTDTTTGNGAAGATHGFPGASVTGTNCLGGAGGAGGNGNSGGLMGGTSTAAAPGATLGSIDQMPWLGLLFGVSGLTSVQGGSGGASGGGGALVASSGAGGSGGGVLLLAFRNLNLANQAAAIQATGGAGGGGGAEAGADAGGGGGGGGGAAIIVYHTNSGTDPATAGLIAVNGGAAGAKGGAAGADGSAGSAGATYIFQV